MALPQSASSASCCAHTFTHATPSHASKPPEPNSVRSILVNNQIRPHESALCRPKAPGKARRGPSGEAGPRRSGFSMLLDFLLGVVEKIEPLPLGPKIRRQRRPRGSRFPFQNGLSERQLARRRGTGTTPVAVLRRDQLGLTAPCGQSLEFGFSGFG